jgi:hypothetical protein
MLENIRKHTALMVVILVILVISLIFGFSVLSRRGHGSGPVVVEVAGRGYTQQEFQRLAEAPLRLLNDLSNKSYQARLAIMSYQFELATPPDGMPGRNSDNVRYMVNRFLLQDAARKFGIHPSKADVEQFLRETIFVLPDGSFDQQGYESYVESDLPRLGMSVQNMNALLGEVLSLQKIQDIIGAGIDTSREAAVASVADRQQQVDYQLVSFPASNFENEQEPTDEEIKTFWENQKGRYLSDPTRKITYVLASPDEEALLAEKKKKAAEEAPDDAGDEADKPDDNSDPTATEDPAAAAELAAPEDPAEPEITLTPEEKEKAVLTVGGELDSLWDQIQQKEGDGFDELVKAAGFELKTTEVFTPESAPEEFKVPMRDAPGKRAVDILFTRDKGTTALDAVSDVRRLGQNQWLLFRIDEATQPKELTFEEAKDEARLDLVKERAREAMTTAAEEAHTKLLEAIKGGKTFAEAAAELELTPVQRTAATLRGSIPGEPNAPSVFDLASKVNPGEVSEVLTQEDDVRSLYRAIFVHVDKRELIDSEANNSMVDQRYRNMGSAMRRLAAQNWLAQQYEAADVRQPAP